MDAILHTESVRTIENLRELVHQFNGKRILITGACGFLGSQFVHLFLTMNDVLEDPCHVIAYDNLMRGKPDWLKLLDGRSDFTFEQKDIVKEPDFAPADYMIHAASIASPIVYRKYPIETMDANVKGSRNVLDAAKDQGNTTVLFLSSSEIYGDPPPEMIPTPETFGGHVSSIGPRACYDESKRYGETLCVNYFRQYGVSVKIVRPFNVYGVGLHPEDGRVLSDFYRDLIRENSIKLLSDGKATRTFCYISDAMNGFIRALLLGKDGEVYNIGNDQPEISIIDLANKIIELTGSNASISYHKSNDPEYLTDNPNRRCPSIKKAKSDLKYDPVTTLDEGLQLTYSYYKSIL